MKDQLEVMHEFGRDVIKALQDAKVKQPDGKFVAAVMIIVMEKDNQAVEPIGASLNYDEGKQAWLMADQLEMAERVDETKAGNA